MTAEHLTASQASAHVSPLIESHDTIDSPTPLWAVFYTSMEYLSNIAV